MLGAAMLGCKKENKCRTCGIEQWNSTYNQYIKTSKMQEFCGTEKEFKAYQEQKKSQGTNLYNCSE